MPDEPPDNHKAMSALLDTIAVALLVAAVESFADQKSWHIWGGCFALGVVLFLGGVNWPRIKWTIDTRLSLCLSLALLAVILVIGFKWPQLRLRIGALLVGYVLIYGIIYVRSLRKDIDAYVLPRKITSNQAKGLREFLSQHEPQSVTVKVNPRDAEARDYAGQIFNALKRTDWKVAFNTSDAVPNTPGEGLSISVIGMNARPSGSKQPPDQLLQQAFSAARIVVNGSGGIGAGNYALFVLVGPRPLRLLTSEPLLRRFGRWLGTHV